jgi:hypothetical protein
VTGDGTRLVVQTSRIKLTSVLVANFVFGMACLVHAKEGQDWLLYGFAAFFTVMSVTGWWVLMFRRATLVLDASGVCLEQKRMRWVLAWPDVAQVHFVDTRINGVRTNRMVVLVDRQGRERPIPSSLTVTPDQLAALINARRSQA